MRYRLGVYNKVGGNEYAKGVRLGRKDRVRG